LALEATNETQEMKYQIDERGDERRNADKLCPTVTVPIVDDAAYESDQAEYL